MSKILEEVMKNLPDDAGITSTYFEGANIVLYTKNKKFFLDNEGAIKKVVENIKKRVELRSDPSIVIDMEEAKEKIEKILPKECGIVDVIFDPQRSMVIVEVEKPGLAIGKEGALLKEIKTKTLWVPLIRRTPPIRSTIIENIRKVLYENNDYRKKFLNNVGSRIYDGWIREKKHEWVRVSFLGAAREVGRSALLLQTPESRVLIDCGVNVAASDDNAFPFLDAPEFDINQLDAVILTHPHLDHVGFAPYLFKYGYKGPVYCSEPTRDIAALLCLDLIEIAQRENKKVPYTPVDVKNMVKHAITLNYEEVTDITPDIRLTLYNAGHNLGSSMAHLHIGNGLHNLLITGDFNYDMTNLLAPAVTKFPRLETVIMESTYGSSKDVFPTRQECDDYLISIIKETIGRGGKVLMPVLGVGRSQEILLIIERMVRERLIEKVPVFIQGMVWDVTAIHTAYPDFFNNKIKKTIFHKDENPFLSDIFKRIVGQKEMESVIKDEGPCIIMATSGMMTGGPSVYYFKHLAENPNNSLVLTCYQGEGSLGRRLQEGDREFSFLNGEKENLKVKMNIHIIRGYSGHSNYEQLLRWVSRLDPKPKKIIINHGESSKCLEMASTIHKANRIETNAPKNLESIRIR